MMLFNHFISSPVSSPVSMRYIFILNYNKNNFNTPNTTDSTTKIRAML